MPYDRNKRNRTQGQGGRGARKCTDGSISFTETIQKDLTKRFSQSKYFEELHKHKKGEKKGEYIDYRLTKFWVKFHEFRKMLSCIGGVLLGSQAEAYVGVEDVVSRVYAALNVHMRWLFEHNHLPCIPFSPMIPFVKAAVNADPFTASSTAVVVRTTECRPEILLFSLPFYSCFRTHLSFTRPHGWCSPII
ncbi:hypothetical protein M9H77_35786 [Catharanthus roseus]|uniref:Uncharacterized protein n=1 Tax=Catharanthus roseus TaxID=4058 RepID=A0ACB9ZSK0_CATRO|nr:hypothetical protein M9H77_35786 [Catharanthus roseus]